ncbi:MAG: 2-hydroxyacyl-CoA dehydratase family protein [Deltaproteobacteria bacterium]|nr:2-hydroxyacyl-CoA dehydratase family protein [Deltaproteobacteria bacterium]
MIQDIPEKERHIGYACSYVPVEIILAGGMVPWRLLPKRVSADADAYIASATCCHIKGIFSEALRGEYDHLDGIILADSCDGMRRLADILSSHARNIPVLFLDIPKKKEADSISCFAFSLQKLIDDMQREFSGRPVTTEQLQTAIRECNSVRRLMSEVFIIQKNEGRGIGGLALLDLCREAGRTKPDAFSQSLKTFIKNTEDTPLPSEIPRVVLTGNAFHQPEVIAHIEQARGRIVALDSCIGERYFRTIVHEDGSDPVIALAERYLLKSPCARMDGMGERIDYLRTLIRESRANGVICLTPKYCDTLLYELPLLKDRAGVPFLAIEHDPDGLSAQAVTRIEAFLEMLKGEKVHA